MKEPGVCPVATHEELEGVHGGKKAGRACWTVVGTLCGGKIQKTYAQKIMNCWGCDFMNHVKKEEEAFPFGFSHATQNRENPREDKSNIHNAGELAR